MKKSIIYFIFLSSFLLSCSNHEEDDYSYDTFEFEEEESELLEKIRDVNFYCSNQNECPENVGLIYLKSNDLSIAQCTGFLISDSIVATNSHCIPENVKSNQECSEDIAIRFSLKGENEYAYSCKRLISYSELEPFGQDFAFFEIKSTKRSPLIISQEGLRDDSVAKILKVTPLNASKGGKLEVEDCDIHLNTLLNLRSTNRYSETGTVFGCQVISGNSGSPILNEKNEVIGIVQSHVNENYKRLIERTFKTFGTDLPRQLPDHGQFTNLACVSIPEIDLEFNKTKCNKGKNLKFQDCVGFNTDGANNLEKSLVRNWVATLPQIFQYKIVLSEDTQLRNAEIECIKPERGFENEYSKYVKKGWFSKDQIEETYDYGVSMGFAIDVDNNYKVLSELKMTGTIKSPYTLSVKKNNEAWSGTLGAAKGTILDNIKFPITILECSDAQLTKGNTHWVRTKENSLITEEEFISIENNKDKVVCEK